MADKIMIKSEVDKRNPAICRFTVNRTLHIGTATFNSDAETQQSALVQKLFGIQGVTRVQLIGHLLVVTKSGEESWLEITERISSILEAYLISGLALSAAQVEDRMMP